MPEANLRQRSELQSVRGIAALGVVACHGLFYYNIDKEPKYWFEFLLNAHADVVLFFVLSGFVLTRSLYRKPLSISNYAEFCVRRAFRIYPVLFVSVGLALSYLYMRRFLPPTGNRTPWALNFDTHHVVPGDVIGSFLGARDSLVPPLWTIKVELLASLTLPFLAWLAVARRWSGLPALCVVAALLGIYSFRAGLDGQYLVDFALGAIAVVVVDKINAITRPDRKNSMMLCGVVAMLMLFRSINPAWDFDADYHAAFPALVEGVLSAIFIVMLETSDIQNSILLNPTMIWIGDISYSIYLLHFPIMEYCTRILQIIKPQFFTLHPTLDGLTLTFLTIAIVIPISSISYRLIELRGIEWGRWLVLKARLALQRPSGLLANRHAWISFAPMRKPVDPK